MNRGKKVILHIICDSIQFDNVYLPFEEMEGYENRYLFKDIGVDKSQLKFIRHTDKVICAKTLGEWGEIISNSENDIIYFQGLWKSSLKAIDYIRKDMVVMWWCFGQEIYDNEYGWAPLLPIRLYKPRTYLFVLRHSKTVRSLLSKSVSCLSPHLFDALQSVRYHIQGKRKIHKEMLSRIDYAFTPLPIELDEMKKRHPYLKAKPFTLRRFTAQIPFHFHEEPGHILFDHSAMSNNNHLDLLPRVKKLHLAGRTVYIPLSYGNRYVADYMKQHASFDGAETQVLTEVLSKSEYLDLLCNCSHALFGTIRQSGLGNVNILLRKGVKVFFFEDSMMYKHFKREGFFVFSIEKDLNDVSISTPLPYEMALHNYNLFYEKIGTSNRTYQQHFDSLFCS
jgi:hypothetical protein